MTAVTALPPPAVQRSRPFTRADLETMPDDGRRHELIDGTLVVTPSPGLRHQDVVLELAVLLRSAAPAGCHVVLAPFDVVVGDDTVLQPDVLVARRSDLTDKNLPAAPLLAVEVLSPATRMFDRNMKRATFERAGTPAFWVVDPLVPSLTAWELRDGAYVQPAEVSGDQAFAATVPFPVTVVPSELVSAERPR
ncbi:MAG: hypothetical protein QOE45_1056 [Frankiaceae bacterium]|jgi:Uma2 family endonuclease|nr:hypothetical protein [Frankiaceae bacterium]